MQQRPPIVVAGGGIGGLAVALALAKVGRATQVLEPRTHGPDVGAGIQLGPNAVSALRALGVAEVVGRAASAPDALVVRDASTGATLMRMPLGAEIERRHAAPYWVVHRADLHQALREAAAAHPLISAPVPHAAVGIARPDSEHVEITLDDGTTVAGSGLIGADGYRSTIRTLALSPEPVRASGYCAYRALIPADRAAAIDATVVGAWLSPRAHLVHYPVRSGRLVNIVLIVRDRWTDTTWGHPVDRIEPERLLSTFAADLRRTCGEADSWHKWSLPQPLTIDRWSTDGPVTILGDAAHPMLPFFAQGGAMALEDAVELAAAVRDSPHDTAAAFNRYATARMPRVRRVQRASTANGRIFHLAGSLAMARNLSLRLMPGRVQLASYDWLYGYKGPTL